MGRQRVQISRDNQETKAKTSGMEIGAVVCVLGLSLHGHLDRGFGLQSKNLGSGM